MTSIGSFTPSARLPILPDRLRVDCLPPTACSPYGEPTRSQKLGPSRANRRFSRSPEAHGSSRFLLDTDRET